MAVWQGGPDHLRHRIGNGAKLRFAVAQGRFHAYLRCDVHLRHDRADDIFDGIPNRFGMRQDGAALSRRAEGLDLDNIAGRTFSTQCPHQAPLMHAYGLPVPV